MSSPPHQTGYRQGPGLPLNAPPCSRECLTGHYRGGVCGASASSPNLSDTRLFRRYAGDRNLRFGLSETPLFMLFGLGELCREKVGPYFHEVGGVFSGGVLEASAFWENG